MNETKNFPEPPWKARICLNARSRSANCEEASLPSYLRAFAAFFSRFSSGVARQLSRGRSIIFERFSPVTATVAIA
jgi:hypothetical protein